VSSRRNIPAFDHRIPGVELAERVHLLARRTAAVCALAATPRC
jgi:hypothetical protein